MERKVQILDSPFFNKKKEETWGQRTISILNIIISTLMIIQCLLYIYYWNLATEFLGWRPSDSYPDPKDMGDMPVRGNLELKEIVVGNYELVYNSLGIYLLLFYALPIFLFLLLIIQRGKKRIVIFSYGLLAMSIAWLILSKGFFGWIAD